MKKKLLPFLVTIFIFNLTLVAQKNKTSNDKLKGEKDKVATSIDSKFNFYGTKAKQIWDFAEVGYKEYKSVKLLQEMLETEGFTIESGVADIPTAFIATFGNGFPTVAILGEYDALPGISQDTTPYRKILEYKTSGHACGHHMFGVGSVAAAIETKNWMVKNNIKGTIKFFGCPAEEGGSGKVYLVRAGLFKNVDIALHWHPSDGNAVESPVALSNMSVKFRFKGLSAHASASPEKGKSALDGVEAMDYMANLMREHMPSDARLHYIITSGGKAPNVVPDFAEVYYYVRHKNIEVVKDLFSRLVKMSEGAAMGTRTTTEYEIIGGTYPMLANKVLSEVMYKNLASTNGYTLDAQEMEFAKKIYSTLSDKTLLTNNVGIKPFWEVPKSSGSTDVGDVSYAVPTVGLRAATWVQGTPAHSWQAIAAGGMSIGTKGLVIAAKTIAFTAMDIFTNPKLVEESKNEFDKNRGADFIYSPMLGDRKPALDYRD